MDSWYQALHKAAHPNPHIAFEVFQEVYGSDTLEDVGSVTTFEMLTEDGLPAADAQRIVDAMYGQPAYTETSGEPKAGDKWTSPGRMAFGWPDLVPSTRHVLFAMAAHADNQGNGIYIAQSTLAKQLGYSVKTVRRAQQELEQIGALTLVEPNHQHRSKRWRVNPPPEVKS